MAKKPTTKVSGRVDKVTQKLTADQKRANKAITSLERSSAKIENLVSEQKEHQRKRNSEIREVLKLAKKRTKQFQAGFLIGVFGDKMRGGAVSSILNDKEDDSKVKKAVEAVRAFRKKDEKTNKFQNDSLKSIIKQQKQMMREFKQTAKDQRTEAKFERKRRTEALSQQIRADEEPLLKLNEKFDQIISSIGLSGVGVGPGSVHQKLDALAQMVANGGGGGGFDIPMGFGRGGPRRGPRGGGGGRLGRLTGPGGSAQRGVGRIGTGGLLIGAAGAYAGYQAASGAVGMLRNQNLNSYNPALLDSEAEKAVQVGDTEYGQALGQQVKAQKRDVLVRSGQTVAGGAAAIGGAVVATKVARRVAASPAMKAAGSRTWNLFVRFVQRKSPALAARLGARLATAGVLATVPIAGWIGTALTIGFSLSLVYELFKLWQEFSALSDVEKKLAAMPPPKPATPPATPATTSAPTSAAPTAPTPSAPATPAPSVAPSTGGSAMPSSVASGPTSAGAKLAEDPKNANIIKEMENAGLTNKFAQIALLANIKKESNFKPISEDLNYSSVGRVKTVFTRVARRRDDEYIKDNLLRNPQGMAEEVYGKDDPVGRKMGSSETGDGWTYRGRGFIQLTGKRNYEMYGKMIGKDLVNNPDLVNDPTIAARVAAAFVMTGLKGNQNFKSQQEANRAVTQTIGGAGLNLDKGYGATLLSKVNDYSGAPSSLVSAGSSVSSVPSSSVGSGGGSVSSGGGGSSPSVSYASAAGISGGYSTPTESTGMLAAIKTNTDSILRGITALQSGLGQSAINESSNYNRNMMTAQVAPSPPVIISQGTVNPQPITPPRTPLPMAAARAQEDSFVRAISRDFVHPSALTSVGVS
jgi:predicted chitinase